MHGALHERAVLEDLAVDLAVVRCPDMPEATANDLLEALRAVVDRKLAKWLAGSQPAQDAA